VSLTCAKNLMIASYIVAERVVMCNFVHKQIVVWSICTDIVFEGRVCNYELTLLNECCLGCMLRQWLSLCNAAYRQLYFLHIADTKL